MAGDLLKNLVLDKWYKVVILLSAGLLVTSLVVDIKGVTNLQLQTISLGVLLVGLGVWIDQRSHSYIKEANAFTGGPLLITVTKWRPTLFGAVVDLAGIALVVVGVMSVMNQPAQNAPQTPSPMVVATSEPTSIAPDATVAP